MIICRKEVLEKVNGLDEGLAYGEDGDLSQRISQLDLNRVSVDAAEYHGLVSSLSEVFRQGRWYGKSMIPYFRKHPEAFPSLLSIGFFTVLPFVTLLAFFHSIFFYLALAQYAAVSVYLLIGLYRTGNPYILAVPVIKVVRSIAEVIGMIEGFFTTDFGRE